MRRRLGLLVLLLAAASCAPRRPPPPAEILVWQPWPVAVIRPLADEFERAHPGLVVRLRQLSEPEEADTLAAALAEGRAPELCVVRSTRMGALLAGGRLADWSAGVADLRDSLRGWEVCSVGEALYGLPWVLAPRVLFYDKTLLARAGVDSSRAPATWDELERAAAAVQRLGHGVHGYGIPAGTPGALARDLLSYAWGNGGRVLSDDGRKAVFDSAANVEAVDFYLRLAKSALPAPPDSLEREFARGRLGLVLGGPGLLRRLRRDARGLRFDVDLAPAPAGDRGQRASWAEGEVLVSFNLAKRKHEALELARFLVQPVRARVLAAALGDMEPAAAGAESTSYYGARPRERVMLRQLAAARYAPAHPAWEEMEAAIEDEVGRALGGKTSAAGAVQAAQSRLVELVEKR